MKKDQYMLKFVLIVYGVSFLVMGIGLIELLRYINDFVIRKWALTMGLSSSIIFLFFYIVTFRDEVELGKMKKSVLNFIVGFVPTFAAFVFNLLNFLFLINKI